MFILCIPSLSLYFHQDEFIHFRYSQNITQVIQSFNIFQKGEFPFYRPLPTQVYFYLGKVIFGLNPVLFRLTNFVILSLNILLVYTVVKKITNKQSTGAIASVIYGINSTHIAPLFAPAYIHELLYVFLALLCIYAYVVFQKNKVNKNYLFAILFYILALMTKENAVILPGILAIYELIIVRSGFKKVVLRMTPFAILLSIYIVGHFLFYGLAKGASYTVQIGKPTINIFFWYFSWALSTPNILVDFLGPKLTLNPILYAVAGIHAYIFIYIFPVVLFGLFILAMLSFTTVKDKKDWIKVELFAILWFVLGIVPLLPFPGHKLGTEQAFSLVGLSLGIGYIGTSLLYSRKSKYMFYAWMSLYLILATNTIILARKTHWIAISSKQAQNAIEYIKKEYTDISDSDILYFKDGEIVIPEFGSSKQMYYALGSGYGVNLMLNKPEVKVYFQFKTKDIPKNKKGERVIIIDSSKLLGY